MKAYVGVGNTGRFAGLFATLVNAASSYGGVEMVAVGEFPIQANFFLKKKCFLFSLLLLLSSS
jgi:hypothetical protein